MDRQEESYLRLNRIITVIYVKPIYIIYRLMKGRITGLNPEEKQTILCDHQENEL